MGFLFERNKEEDGFMNVPGIEKPFGAIAIERRFITLDQFIEAMTLQVREDLNSLEHRPIGQILLEMGYLSDSQIKEILQTLVGLPL
ncbi:hypothetical protein ACFL4N_01510 [Thermodesulfobacteriota bacterium]